MNTVWEKRWHPLREEWVIVCAHRGDRPWTGGTLDEQTSEPPEYDKDCYLCPGNKRVGGAVNENYTDTFVFDNDHPCVSFDAPNACGEKDSFCKKGPADGIARVVCYHPKHNSSMAELSLQETVKVMKVWQDQFRGLKDRKEINHILIFENKGEICGVSNPHPHCQIYATGFVAKIIETEAGVCEDYFKKHGKTLFSEIISEEIKDGRRVVCENEHAMAFVPYFARYAYEVFVAPRRSCQNIAELSSKELNDLADVFHRVVVKYDNLWKMSFPYVMALHQAPVDNKKYKGFHFHIEFYPPLRKPGLMKYLAGAEIGGGNFLTDTCPEEKAEELRNLPDIHYKANK